MERMSKEKFRMMLAVTPHAAIGRELSLKDGTFIKILDVSLGGGYILIEDKNTNITQWMNVDHIDEEITIMDYSQRRGDDEIVSITSMYDLIDKETKEIIDIAIENKEVKSEILKRIREKPSKIIDFDKK